MAESSYQIQPASTGGKVRVLSLSIGGETVLVQVLAISDPTSGVLASVDASGRLTVNVANLPAGASTEATLASILAKITADPATQTTLAAVLAKLTADPATQTTLALIQSVLSAWTFVNGAGLVTEMGIPNQRHRRYRSGITNAWPGNDTFSVTFTPAENVRRYRVLVTGGADGDYVRVAEDAVNEAQAEAWLAAPTSSGTVDVESSMVHTSTPDANGSFIPLWSEWFELSKDLADLSLARLDFFGSTGGPFAVYVEAE
jgi:hypothetical protein